MGSVSDTPKNQAVKIVADIGGTHARLAFVSSGSDQLQAVKVFQCAEFVGVYKVIEYYRRCYQLVNVEMICLAVAAPVIDDDIAFINSGWRFNRRQLAAQLGVPVIVINDFSAQMLAVEVLTDEQLIWLGAARPVAGQVTAIVGPGTGLGVAAKMLSGEIVPSEGGHIAFAPLNDHEMQLLGFLQQRYQRVSVERILSGHGLANLYWANGQCLGLNRQLSATEITAAAFAGDALCLQSIQDFVAILGSVAGDVALMMGATGGVYLAGGILPKILGLVDQTLLRQRFDDKGRYSDLCRAISLAIVIAEQPGLQGCVNLVNHSNCL